MSRVRYPGVSALAMLEATNFCRASSSDMYRSMFPATPLNMKHHATQAEGQTRALIKQGDRYPRSSGFRRRRWELAGRDVRECDDGRREESRRGTHECVRYSIICQVFRSGFGAL